MIKKIISTSVFGSNHRYIVGAKRQVSLAKHYYPNWEFRLYTDNPNNFADVDANVIHIKDGTSGTFWRFFPLFEDDSTITIVRDADSRITAREAMAVYEWMASDKAFHIMKDHPQHPPISILAGMFGLKGRLDKECLEKMIPYLYSKNEYGTDQHYLHFHVFPKIRDHAMTHEIYHGWFGLSRHFLSNRYEWVGNGWYEDDRPVYPPTTEEKEGFDPMALPDSAKFSSYPAQFV
jgi:hypothetical protein